MARLVLLLQIECKGCKLKNNLVYYLKYSKFIIILIFFKDGGINIFF